MRSLVVLALVVVSSSACAATRGSGIKLTETRKVSEFTEIVVSDGVFLEVKKGAPSLTIEGDDNLVPLFVTEVVDGRLRIHRKTKDWVRTSLKLVVRVTTPALRRLEASGGVEVRLEDVAAPAFTAELSGGVELTAKGLELDSLDLEASGGVNVTLSGRSQAAKWKLSGGVDLKAQQLQVAQVSVDASGGCDVELTAKDSVVGEASGGVGLKVYGNPPKSRVHTSGGADVEYVD